MFSVLASLARPAAGAIFLRTWVAAGIGVWLLAGRPALSAGADADEDPEQSFLHPPDSARPWVYWFWVDGNATREGITADLEAMQRVGIGGVLLLDVTQQIPPGPVVFGSPQWRELFKHAVYEAGRLGLELSLHNAAGWTGSGGPWITPELAMQKVVYGATNLTGPVRFNGALPRLAEGNGSSRAIATLAFPTLVGEGAPVPGFPPKVTASIKRGFEGEKLVDGDSATSVTLPAPKPGQPQYVQLAFAEPFTACSLKLVGAGQPQHFQGTLQVSDDGRAFRDIREFVNTGSRLALPFEQLSARYFRILLTQADARLTHLDFSELELSPSYRLALYQCKAGLGPLPSSAGSEVIPRVPSQAVIAPGSIIDLSLAADSAGHLAWNVPRGQWTVLRLASVANGMMNHPARAGGLGLECDKLSREAVDVHFAGFLGQMLDVAGEAAGRSFVGAHIDSWEVGYQNWTPRFREEFQRRRGYDPLNYLPTFSGRFVGSAEQSERFLWDVRRTIADLLADNYAGHLAELAHQHGLQLSIEAYGSLGKGPFDELQYAARADLPMTEFWRGEEDSSKLDLGPMPSAGHTAGKAIVAAEAFTSYANCSKWQEHPFALKALGDAAFCEGVNRFVIHRYAHQPWLDRQPGMTMGSWGVHYERTQTWWEQSKAWHQYLARCQFLLQRGRFVADVCYLTSEGAFTDPPRRDQLTPPLPLGYSFDLTTPETVLTRMSVKDGRLVLPDGMCYRVLALAAGERMTPTLLRKIKQLVESGATIVGARPAKSPSLTDFPHCDAEVEQLAGELWGPCDGKTVKEHPAGSGVVVWGKSLAAVLADLRVPPDFQPRANTPGWPLRCIHRCVNGDDFYFVANANPRPLQVECLFGVAGKRPEFWHPDTGQTERPAIWRQDGTRTLVQLKFDPAGSLFVVFRRTSLGLDPVVAITRNGKADEAAQVTFDAGGRLRVLASQPGTYEVQTVSGKKLQREIKGWAGPILVAGKWQLHFPPRSGAPESVTLDRLASWTDHNDPGVKYFSGTATYLQSVHVPAEFLAPHRRIFLDLGKVQVIAELKVNGQNVAILWKPPFEADITGALKAGDNALEIKVVNLWPNRLIGDEQLGEDCRWGSGSEVEGRPLLEWPQWILEDKPSPTGRLTFATWKNWTRGSHLLESGLLGPVTLRLAEEFTLQ